MFLLFKIGLSHWTSANQVARIQNTDLGGKDRGLRPELKAGFKEF